MPLPTPPRAAHPPGTIRFLVPVAASVFGFALDLFDLFILLYVAPVVGRLFLPITNPTLSLAAVYASFAVTLLLRPVGSAIFGSFADRSGRKRAMSVAVIGVGVATAAFGVLPTLAQAGVLSPILFLALRLIQGVFVGGVVATTHTVGTESVPPHWRGAVSGLVGGGGAGLGALMASIAFFAASALFPGAAFDVWGWRVMFFFGIISSVLGLIIARQLEESPSWLKAKATRVQQAGLSAAVVVSPLRTLFSQQHRGTILANLIVTAAAGTAYYCTAGYLPSFLKLVNGISNDTASYILIGAAFVATVASPLIGYISDVIGRRKCFAIIGIIGVMAVPTLYMRMSYMRSGDVFDIAIDATLIVLLGNAVLAPVPIFLNERFPTYIRASGTGLSWNIGFAIGGIMPTFVSLLSPTPAAIPLSLAYFCGAAFLLYLVGALVIPATTDSLE